MHIICCKERRQVEGTKEINRNRIKKLKIVNKLPVNYVKRITQRCTCVQVYVRVMMFNAAFNNISVISWRSVILVEETGENRKSPNVISSTSSRERDSNSQL